MAVFSLFANFIKHAEGGFQANPSDKGNYNSKGELIGTNRGISGKLYEAIKGFIPTINHIKAITIDEARSIFKLLFWDKVKADTIQSQAVAEIITDHAINGGIAGTMRIVIEVLNTEFKKGLPSTSSMNSNVIAALNSINSVSISRALLSGREKYYRSTGNKTFLNGWIRRVVELSNKHNLKAYTSGDSGLFCIGQKVYAKWGGMPLRYYKKSNGVIQYHPNISILKMYKNSEYVGIITEIQRYQSFDVVVVKLPNGTIGTITSNAIKK